MRVIIQGKPWRLDFTRLPKDRDGDCDPPTAKAPRIRVRSSLTGERRLEVIIHEFAHASDWSKDETWVHQFARELAHLLTELGYEVDE